MSPNRRPKEIMIDIAEDQRGISYEKLFLPYLKEAKSIKFVNLYIRLQYQIYNLMSFCEILDPFEGPLTLALVTGCETNQKPEQREKLAELKKGLVKELIQFKYSIDNTLHGPWNETDTGWKIILGRWLDIFQKSDDKFTLGLLDQTKHRCKATTITYTRVK